MKWKRLAVIGLAAALLVPFAPQAQAKYPPGPPFRQCAQLLNAAGQPQGAFALGEAFRVDGAPGCALTNDGTARTNVRVFLAYRNNFGNRVVVQRNRLGALNGSFSTHWSTPTNAQGGLQRIIVRILDDQAVQNINIQNNAPANAALPATKTTVPFALALTILGAGLLVLFTPMGRLARRSARWRSSRL